MAVSIYILKRYLKKKRRNGRHRSTLMLRWKDPTTGKWKCERTGTADMIQARELQRKKWAQVNRLAVNGDISTRSQPEKLASWEDCRNALKRAMRADNLRPSYVADALLLFDAVHQQFPDLYSPAKLTPALANEYKRQRATGDPRRGITPVSPWTLRGDLSALKAIFGKWLVRECGLLSVNPFAGVKPPRCDDPDVRLITADELGALFNWFGKQWNDWRLPIVYLEIAVILGWRATEIASLQEEDILKDGFVRIAAKSSKTRKHKIGWLPEKIHAELRGSGLGGWAFGRFPEELRRLLVSWKGRPHHAARVKEFSPSRLVGWLQDELKRYNQAQAKIALASQPARAWQPFTLHDFRRTAITGLQMAGVSEKETSIMVGATPEVIRRHYERMDLLTIARRSVQRRLSVEGDLTSL